MTTGITAAPPATEGQLQAAEQALGFPLPGQYRSFLRVHNGGRPMKPWCNEMVGVAQFLGVGSGDVDDLVLVHQTYRGRMPERFLPVASAEGGNLILLSTDEADPGVYFWDHEDEGSIEDGQMVAAEAVPRLLAPSFEELLSTLSARPPLPDVKVLSAWIDPAFQREVEGR